ncbi:MAG: hypothetical protein GY696_25420 [Gammaproteobacteria bacterium]|nr:hypothetical protein [Gammaproteobacteria bacterium]
MVKKLGDLGVGKEHMDAILDEGAGAGDGVGESPPNLHLTTRPRHRSRPT